MSRIPNPLPRWTAVALAATLLLSAFGCAGKAARPPMRFDHPKGSATVPLVVYIHGGGWQAGDRLSDVYYKFVRARLLTQGVAVASVDYRLAPAHVFPTQILDVTYAVRWLRANAKSLHINPDRIGAFGTSAGGHLVSLLGTIDPSAGFDVGPLTNVASRVKAVVDIVGPADLTGPGFPPVTATGIQTNFGVVGGTANAPALLKASPVTYASPDDPPFLLVHGTVDELVPFSQSVELAGRLKAVGVRAELVPVVGGTHALVSPMQSINPDQITTRIATFLLTELRR